jgi:hypothetical protein
MRTTSRVGRSTQEGRKIGTAVGGRRDDQMSDTVSLLQKRAHEQAIRADVAQIATELQSSLGQRAIAYVTRNRSPKVVGRWASGDGKPQTVDAERRLRELYRTYLILRDAEDEATIRSWLMGANPYLGDQPPLEILREGNPSLAQHAAEEFVRH